MTDLKSSFALFRSKEFDDQLRVSSTVQTVMRAIRQNPSYDESVCNLRKDRKLLNDCISQIVDMISSDNYGSYKNENDSFIAALLSIVDDVSSQEFEKLVPAIQQAQNLWWAGWVTQHIINHRTAVFSAKSIASNIIIKMSNLNLVPSHKDGAQDRMITGYILETEGIFSKHDPNLREYRLNYLSSTPYDKRNSIFTTFKRAVQPNSYTNSYINAE